MEGQLTGNMEERDEQITGNTENTENTENKGNTENTGNAKGLAVENVENRKELSLNSVKGQLKENTENARDQDTAQPTGKPEAQPAEPQADRNRKRTVVILAVGAVICTLITGYLLFDYHRTSMEAEKAIEALRLESETVSREMPGNGGTAQAVAGGSVVPELPKAENPYVEVFREYPDIKGWLYVEGTAIDYPILQREGEDEYYLYRDFRGEEDKRGSLILDEDSSMEEGESTTNLLIHGHNMKDGSMFGGLDAYRSEDYYKEHTYMTLSTRDGVHEYEVVSVFESQVFYVTDQVFKYYNFFQADTAEEFEYFYDNIKELSLYDTGVEAEYGDRFLTLSTCAYHVEDGRFVVVAREVN